MNQQRRFQLKYLQIISKQKKKFILTLTLEKKKKQKKTFNLSNIVVNFVTNVTGVKVLKGVSNLRNNIACIVQYWVQNGLNHKVSDVE